MIQFKTVSSMIIRSIFLLALTGWLVAADPSILTLERLFSTEEFEAESFGPALWLKKKPGYLTLEKSQKFAKGEDIILSDPESGKMTILVPAERLIPRGQSHPLEIDDFRLSPSENRLLIFTNSQRVWRRKTRGDYWILDLKTGTPRKLGGDADPSGLMFAKFSPDGNRIGYVYKNNIYVQNLDDLQITQLTFDGSKTIINGTFDWVYEEELGLRDGFRWSPDGRHIAFWQLDSSGVKDYILINTTDSLYPEITAIPYPKAGETNSAGRAGIINSRGGPIRWLKLPGDPRNHYIAYLDWAENSREVALQYLNRLQNTNRVMLGNIYSGEVQTVFVDRQETWVEVCDDFAWLDRGKRFLFMSERDGWNHAYLVSRSGEKVNPVTRGPFDVTGIEGIDEKNGWLYYIASPENPSQRFLFRARLDGSGYPRRLSTKDLPGSHSYDISPDSKWAFHTYSSFDTPETVDLIRLPEHRKVKTLVDNRNLKSKVNALKRSAGEFFRVDIGNGILLDAWMMKPPGFDAGKKYPVLFYLYGWPAGQTVRDQWSRNYLWHLMLTQQGYLVMSLDNRGTGAPRGRQWRHSIYRQVGVLNSRDQAAALKEILNKIPFVDKDRIGVWGWSGGGSMSLDLIFRYPDLYRTALAVASVSDLRYYDSIYMERYMGLPKTNPEGYKQGSALNFAPQLKGNLLLVHGTGDDNVHYQNCEALIDELIAHNKPFSLMTYPNRTHSIREGDNTRRHLYELLTRFLKENLPPGPG